MADIEADVLRLFLTEAAFVAGSKRKQAGFATDTLRWLLHDESTDTIAFGVSDDTLQCLLAGNQTLTGQKTFNEPILLEGVGSLGDNATDLELKMLSTGDLRIRHADSGDIRVDCNSGDFKVDSGTKLILPASTTSLAPFSIGAGVNPSSPQEGDIWKTTTDLIARVNGVNESLLASDSTHMLLAGDQTATGKKTFSGGFKATSNLGAAASDPVAEFEAINGGFDEYVIGVTNYGVKDAININQVGVLGANARALQVFQSSLLTNANSHAFMVQSNAAHSFPYALAKFLNDNTSSFATVVEIDDDGLGTAQKIVKTRYGVGLDIDMDGIETNDLTGLKVSAINTGSGDAYAAVFLDGYVGIGTQTPADPLEVYAVGESPTVRLNSSDETDRPCYLRFDGDINGAGGVIAEIQANAGNANNACGLVFYRGLSSDGAGSIVIKTTEIERMVVSEDGDVGIGISGYSPDQRLHIANDSGDALIHFEDVGNQEFEIGLRDGQNKFAIGPSPSPSDFEMNASGEITVESDFTLGNDLIFSNGEVTMGLTAFPDFEITHTFTGDFKILHTDSGNIVMDCNSGDFKFKDGSGGVTVENGDKIVLPASTTSGAAFNMPAGAAPTSPSNGDMWTEGTDLKIRLGGTTYTITKT